MMPETLDLREFLSSVEKAVIERALRSTGGAQAEAAGKLPLTKSRVLQIEQAHQAGRELIYLCRFPL
jgi:transcriptional regulator with GAF, ATPase, and Fis domain